MVQVYQYQRRKNDEKNNVKTLSVLLALILALSSITVLPASAAVSESFTPDPGKLYFDTDGAGWDMSTSKDKVAFYIFGGDFGTEDNPIEPVTQGGKKAIGSAVAGETDVYEFDPVAKEGLSFTPGVQYKIIFVHTNGSNWRKQTYDLYFTTDCFGHVAYADGSTTENPVDSSKSTLTAYWRDIDPEVNGPVLAITSIGNVVGSCPEQGKTKYDIFVDFVSEPKTDYNGRTGLENARYYTVESNIKTEQALIDDIADGLGLTNENVSRAFEETGVETTWSPDTEPPTEAPTESFEYSIIESGYASIKRYNGKDAVVEVPSEFDGNKIEAIEEGAFKDNTFITKVTLPDTINSIGYDAFKGCTSLTEINIPVGFSDGALEGCTALTDLYVNRDVELNEVFGNGALPANLTIHGYTNSKAECFANENNIPFESIGEIPESDHYSYMILNGKDAAVLCSYSGYQEIIDIPDTYEGYPVTVIGMGAFLNNTNVEEIILPDSVTEIRNEYLDQPTDIFFGAFQGCTSLKKINIPDGVTEIVGNTFKGCTSLTEITIPDSVTSIGNGAFSDCSSLTSVTIPDSVTSIDGGAFYNCSSMTSVTIPASVTSIRGGAFGFIDYKGDPVKVDDFTINGYAGSEAERYANDNGFTFVALNDNAILGDADGDGEVTALDATMIQRHNAKMATGIPVETLMCGDVNGDGELDVIDVTLIQRYLAKMPVKYPIGEAIA